MSDRAPRSPGDPSGGAAGRAAGGAGSPERIGYLGLGSNVGDRRAQLTAAVERLPRHGVRVLASSSTYETEPVGEILDQPDFLNACLRIATTHDPEQLLRACKAVERELGREHGPHVRRHAPRPIDVDVLLLGDLTYASERLSLPHAEVTSRRFVLVPLVELDPELTTPDGGRLADALARLDPAVRVSRAGPPLV
ncbi:MAG TPA: 2-amino-4-hydroxy-6-hydroxymethyldihydropteridine diphosphokinase [Conexibacter sp.]|nr:2-amino-4-hydroxy-6-hydroxymethyldihydropteridine diphosphokinase [Conexibacter sp.]